MKLVYQWMERSLPGFPVQQIQLRAALDEGDWGVVQTVEAMRRIVRDSAKDLQMQKYANDTLRSPVGVFTWLKSSQIFTPDPPDVELLQDPFMLLYTAATRGHFKGDCDDVAMLGATLLKCLGHSPVIIVVGREPVKNHGRYEHVFYGYKIDPAKPVSMENVIPFDPQESMFPGKWDANDLKRLSRERIFPVDV